MMPRMIRCIRMAGCGWPAGAGGEALRAASNRQPLLHEFSTDCTTGCISQQDKHQPHGLTVRPAARERTEAAQAGGAAAQERLAAAERGRAQRVPALKAEGRGVTARARALQERRAALAAAVPADLLARYQRLHAAHPPAVVAIRGGTCSGCGVAVPTALQQRVAAGEIVQCLSCGRLLAEG